jgi:hypothetical protein
MSSVSEIITAVLGGFFSEIASGFAFGFDPTSRR